MRHAWMVGLWSLGCQFDVDFDPDSDSPIEETTSAPTLPLVIQGTACTGTSAPTTSVLTGAGPASFTTLGPTYEASDPSIEALHFFLFHESLEMVTGTGPHVVVHRVDEGAGTSAWVGVSEIEDTLVLTTGCKAEGCAPVTLRVEVPAGISLITGVSVLGSVTLLDIDVSDVDIETLLADVHVEAAPHGLRVITQAGALSLDLADTQVLDVFAATGSIDLQGSVTHELCADAGVGLLSVALTRADAVHLRTTTGEVQADLATRAQLVDLRSASGTVRLTLPGGAYALDTVVGPDGALDLLGVVHDPHADDAITVRTSRGQVTVTGR